MFDPVTYKEYLNANKFARFRYKYGLIVMMLCWICLLFICYYMVNNVEELAANPLVYGCKKMNVECVCTDNNDLRFSVNSTGMKEEIIWGVQK